jgi:hypothetical protein
MEKFNVSTSNRKVFDEKYSNNTNEEIQKEILWHLNQNLLKLEQIRTNTKTMITWLIVIPLVIVVLWVLLEFLIMRK